MEQLKKGFTLIEILVVVAIVGIVAVTATGLFTYSLRSNQKTRAILEVKQVGDSAMAVMANKIRGAGEIVSPVCPFTKSPTVKITDADGDEVIFSLEGSKIKQEIAGSVSHLTSAGLTIGPLEFSCFEGIPEVVEISFTLKKGSAGDPIHHVSLDFMTSISLRRNY